MHWQLGPSFEHLFYYYRLVTVCHVNILSCLITTLQSSVLAWESCRVWYNCVVNVDCKTSIVTTCHSLHNLQISIGDSEAFQGFHWNPGYSYFAYQAWLQPSQLRNCNLANSQSACNSGVIHVQIFSPPTFMKSWIHLWLKSLQFKLYFMSSLFWNIGFVFILGVPWSPVLMEKILEYSCCSNAQLK